jgi:hypothetical protein
MVAPYSSILWCLEHFYEIDWGAVRLNKSPLKPSTFIITVDNHITLHFVHYIFNPLIQYAIVDRKLQGDGTVRDVESNHIWEYVVNKYIERTKRMISLHEPPTFLIRDEPYARSGSLNDIAYSTSKFKRVILTRNMNIRRNDSICKTIYPPKSLITDPRLLINKYYIDISSFIQPLG